MHTTAVAGFVVALLVAVALFAGTIRGRRRRSRPADEADTDDPEPDRRRSDRTPQSASAAGSGSPPQTDGDVAAGARRSTDAGPDRAPDDEEVVVRLLEANDGRLPQTDVVRATDWSKSKVSRVLSRMDEAGAVTKIDIGRGNVITLPGEEPAGAARPFED